MYFKRKHIFFNFAQGKGIYRVVVNIGNEITQEELQLIAGGNEGVFQARTFDILEDRTDDIHNITCSK